MTRAAVLLLAATAAAAAAGLALAAFQLGLWRPNHPDPGRFPVWGLDVSHHQGRIDWRAAVSGEPRLRFAYVKATEGGDHVDRRFAENWRGAREAGLRVGAYHFFTFCRPAEDQARNFLAVVPRDADALPPAIDLELGGNCAAVPDRAALGAALEVFSREVERGLGERPVLYVTPEAYDRFVAGAPPRHRLWLRDVIRAPRLPAGAGWTFWQFHHRGRVAGIEGPVDLNVFAGDPAALASL